MLVGQTRPARDFLCGYLRSRDAQRIPDHYGKVGDIVVSMRWDEQEMSALCLHIVHTATAYVNTLVIRDVLAERVD